jgi:hypoxanthine phosphoribosyltransferase
MSDEPPHQTEVSFAHPSEAEFARILDFYQIAWEYEPHTFALRRDEEGNVLEAFSPDFYLPDQDLYVELTTMEQRLITRKHRKLRRLRQLYPDVNIKLLDRSDFTGLMLKYGLDDKDDLIGPRDVRRET